MRVFVRGSQQGKASIGAGGKVIETVSLLDKIVVPSQHTEQKMANRYMASLNMPDSATVKFYHGEQNN
jgi:hypothetical protein